MKKKILLSSLIFIFFSCNNSMQSDLETINDIIFPVNYVLDNEWGGEGFTAGEFVTLSHISFNSDELVKTELFLVDTYNFRFQKFIISNQVFSEYTTYYNTVNFATVPFNKPNGIAVKGSFVYIADTYTNSVRRLSYNTGNSRYEQVFGTGQGAATETGQPVGGSSAADAFNGPLGLAVDNDGKVYVADYNNNRIAKFNEDLTGRVNIGTYGTGNGQFDHPVAIGYDSINNVIYVSESVNCRVQKLTTAGAYITKWGSYGTEYGQFYGNTCIAVDLQGNVYVTDSRNARVQIFTSEGELITVIKHEKLYSPTGIEVDNIGRVYVSDSYRNKFYRFIKK